MRPRRRAAEVPADLAAYDHERWEAWAAEHPAPPVPLWSTAHDAYERALDDAGVPHDVAADLSAREFVRDLRRRMAAEYARRGA